MSRRFVYMCMCLQVFVGVLFSAAWCHLHIYNKEYSLLPFWFAGSGRIDYTAFFKEVTSVAVSQLPQWETPDSVFWSAFWFAVVLLLSQTPTMLYAHNCSVAYLREPRWIEKTKRKRFSTCLLACTIVGFVGYHCSRFLWCPPTVSVFASYSII